MKSFPRGLRAAAALLAVCSLPLAASAQPPVVSGLALKDANGATQNEAVATQSGYFYSQHVIDCSVVSADQAFTPGTIQGCTLTATGRVRVGLSSAAAIGAIAAADTLLTGGVDPSGNQQPAQMDGARSLKVASVAGSGALVNPVAPPTSGYGVAMPAGTIGTRLYLPTSTDSVTYAIESPNLCGVSAPANTVTMTGAAGVNLDENLSGVVMCVTALSGADVRARAY